MHQEIEKTSYQHNAFISYSRKDREFAAWLERALERYSPPKYLKLVGRHLDIFRDEQDFTGGDYFRSLEKHLNNSAKLIVICSPNARKSAYVDDEIRRFLQVRQPSDIIPLLLIGIPNNEANPDNQFDTAFPEALIQALEMPLAVDFRSFNPKKGKIAKGAFADSWYTLLANLLDCSRADIEQREQLRRTRIRNLWLSGAVALGLALGGLTLWALASRDQAIQQQNIAAARRLSAEADLLRIQGVDNLSPSILLAVESIRRLPTAEADHTLRENLRFLPRRVARLSTKQGITAAEFSPDGKRIATGSFEGYVAVSDVFGHELIHWNIGERINSLTFSPDGKWLAVSKQSEIKILDIASGHEVMHFGGVFVVPSMAFSSDGHYLGAASRLDDFRSQKRELAMRPELASSSFGGSSFVEGGERGTLWDLLSGLKEIRLPHQNGVNAVRFSADEKYFVTASSDHTSKVWRVADGHLEISIQHDGAVSNAVFNPDGTLLVTASGDQWELESGESDNSIGLWSLPKGHLVARMRHDGSVNSVAFNPNGTLFASASSDKTARIWSVASHGEMFRLTHDAAVKTLNFSADGKYLATASDDHTARLWDVKDGFEMMRMIHDDSVYYVDFSSDGKYLATAGSDGVVQIWENESSMMPNIIPGGGSLSAFSISPDGKRLAIVDHDGNAKIVDLETGGELLRLVEPEEDAATVEHNVCWKNMKPKLSGGLSAVGYDPSGQYVAATGKTYTVVWQTSDGRELWKLPNEQEQNILAYAPSGGFLALAGWETDGLTLREALSGREIGKLKTSGHVTALAFSPDGQFLLAGITTVRYLGMGACSEATYSIEVWDMNSKKQLANWPTKYWINTLAFNASGNAFAVASEDGSASVRSFPGGEESQRIGFADAVNSVSFSADGRYLATGIYDHSVLVTDLSTSQELLRRAGEEDSIDLVAFTSNQKYLLSANRNAIRVRLWSPDDMVAEACNRLTRNLTKDEWKRYFGDAPYRKTCETLP